MPFSYVLLHKDVKKLKGLAAKVNENTTTTHTHTHTYAHTYVCKQIFLPKHILYGKVAYFELSSHQISEPKQQAKRENIYLAKISERLAN
jgi:hypothetical protein